MGKEGTTYHFVVANMGKTAHEFMIMPSSEGSKRGMQMGAMDKMANNLKKCKQMMISMTIN